MFIPSITSRSAFGRVQPSALVHRCDAAALKRYSLREIAGPEYVAKPIPREFDVPATMRPNANVVSYTSWWPNTYINPNSG
jgi:hypothetical protein